MVEQMAKRAGQDIDPAVMYNLLDENKDGNVDPDELKGLLKKIAASVK